MWTMEPDLLKHLKSLISEKTGLVVRCEDEKRLGEAILSRVKKLKLAGPEEYYLQLKSNTARSEEEWEKIIPLLTVRESFFFRDKGQFRLLRDEILPDLISKRETQRSLNIWSAGCATGEEPYSLAIVVDELLSDRSDWKIFVLGTDIDGEAIEKAKRGIFTSWSFRGVGPQLQKKYFRRHADGWQIIERIREMVQFSSGNVSDITTDGGLGLHLMDLIICRNVFIYFDPETIRRVIHRFAFLLTERGYLMTGHGELYGHGLELGCLRTKIFQESIVYQKISDDLCPTRLRVSSEQPPSKMDSESPVRTLVPRSLIPKPVIAKKKVNPDREMREPSVSDVHSELDKLFLRGDYAAVIEIGEQVVKDGPPDFCAYQMLAQAYANVGLYEKAAENCGRMIRINRASANPFFLLATIAEAQGDKEEAKKLLKKAIYIDPGYVAAYLELGGLYEGENHSERARKMLKTALELLDALPPDTLIEPYRNVTARELVQHVVEKLP